MVFAKAKTEAACTEHEVFRRARQSGLVGVLGGSGTQNHDESSDWPLGQTDGQADAADGICVPASPRSAFLGWKHSESDEFSSGEEESFGSESRVNSRRVFTPRRQSPRGFRYNGGMQLSAWLLRIWQPRRCRRQYRMAFESKVEKDLREVLESLPRVSRDCGQGEEGFLFRASNKDFARPSL